MAQLWGGRFEKSTDDQVFAFNASICFDKRLLEVDIEGSKIHAAMLLAQGVLTEEEEKTIRQGLDTILKDVQSGTTYLSVMENNLSVLKKALN